jgi:curved DNA-binding protein CbpA
VTYSPGAVKTYYELLEVTRDASTEDIKRAFRREIAKYHPDKVQHLGREFQEIAANKAAELTQAYKTLSDPERRAEYDELLAEGGAPESAVAAPSRPVAEDVLQPPRPQHRPPSPPPSEPRAPQFGSERQGLNDLMRRATVVRFQNSLLGEFGKFETVSMPGFEVAILPTPNFWSLKLPPRVLGRFVSMVNGQAVAETWTLASKMKKDIQRDLCVFLMGPQLASATELAVAIAEQRKKPMPAGGKLVLIPVNTTDWSAHIPTDAPNVCKSVLARLKSNT